MPPVMFTGSRLAATVTCERLGAEVTELAGGAMDVATNAAERANRKKNMPTSVSATLTNQALATAAGSVPGGAAVLGTIMGVIQQAQEAAENRQVAKDEQAFAALGGAEQQASLDRLLTLHELYAAKCEGSEG